MPAFRRSSCGAATTLLVLSAVLLLAIGGVTAQTEDLRFPSIVQETDQPSIIPLDLAANAAASSDEAGSELVSAAATAITGPAGPPATATSTAAYNEELAAKAPTADELKGMEGTIKKQVADAKTALSKAINDPVTGWAEYCRLYSLPTKICGDASRQKIWLTNLQQFAATNAKLNDEYLAYGITQFSHLTPSEFASTMLMQPSALSNTTTLRAARLARLRQKSAEGNRKLLQGSVPCGTNTAFPGWSSALPTYWDWRNAGVITPVKNQGGCGSCSDFATLATLESTWIRKWWSLGYRSTNTDLAEDDWLECTAGNQCAGAWPDSVFDRFICKGAPFEAAAPYDAMDSNTCRSIPRYNTGAVGFAYVAKDPTSLAKAVRRNPTVIAVDASNWHGLAAGWVRNCGEPYSRLNHAVTVVGWIDNVPMSNGQTWNFWYVRNSWGTGFNNAGYIWIRKDCAAGSVGPYGMYATRSWTPVM